MNYSTLDKDKNVIQKYTGEACFSTLFLIKDKNNIQYVHYKPRVLEILEKNCLDYLSKISAVPFFIYENENLNDVLKNGILVSASLPIINLYSVLTLVRYLEEKPHRVNAFLKLVNRGLSATTALAFCHLLNPDNTVNLYESNHELMTYRHFTSTEFLRNYHNYLYENINSGIPFNKKDSSLHIGLWEFLFRKINNADVLKNVYAMRYNEVINFAEMVDK